MNNAICARVAIHANMLMPRVAFPGVLMTTTGTFQPSAPKRLLGRKPIMALSNFVKPSAQPNDSMSVEDSYNHGRGTHETGTIGIVIGLVAMAAIIFGLAAKR